MPRPKQTKQRFIKKIRTPRNILLVVCLVGLAAFGAWRVFLSEAATWNCVDVQGGRICDVNQAIRADDSVWSVDGEVDSLRDSGWAFMAGPAWRAPMFPQNGAQPIWRVSYGPWTIHDLEWQGGRDRAVANGWTDEGERFYAWPDNRQPGTVPVYKVARGGFYLMNIFTTDLNWVNQLISQPNGYYENKGIAFYAYPATWAPNGGVNPSDCSQAVNFWTDRCRRERENLAKPATPAPKPAPAPTAPQAPKPTPSQPGGNPTPQPVAQAPTAPSGPIGNDPCPSAPNMDEGLALYGAGVNSGKKYEKDCHTWYLTYAKNKNDEAAIANAASIAATSTAQGAPTTGPEVPCPTNFADYLNLANKVRFQDSQRCHHLWLTFAASPANNFDTPDEPDSGTNAAAGLAALAQVKAACEAQGKRFVAENGSVACVPAPNNSVRRAECLLVGLEGRRQAFPNYTQQECRALETQTENRVCDRYSAQRAAQLTCIDKIHTRWPWSA